MIGAIRMSDTTTTQFRTVITPYICVSDGARAIEFYKAAFGAVEMYRIDDNDKISHAELQIGGVPFFLSDEYPPNVLSPETVGGTTTMLVVEVEDVDTFFNLAIAAGATLERPLADTFGGALRNGKLNDPFGHSWMILTRKHPLDIEKR
jgi:PhnB protein